MHCILTMTTSTLGTFYMRFQFHLIHHSFTHFLRIRDRWVLQTVLSAFYTLAAFLETYLPLSSYSNRWSHTFLIIKTVLSCRMYATSTMLSLPSHILVISSFQRSLRPLCRPSCYLVFTSLTCKSKTSNSELLFSKYKHHLKTFIISTQ